MPDAGTTCPGFAFSTCAAIANPYTVTAEGNTTICSNDSVKLNAVGATGIQWCLNQQPIAGAVKETYWAKAGGDYTVKVANGSCYSVASNVITVSTIAVPAKPVISKQGATVLCDGTSVQLTSSVYLNNQCLRIMQLLQLRMV